MSFWDESVGSIRRATPNRRAMTLGSLPARPEAFSTRRSAVGAFVRMMRARELTDL